MSWFCRICYIKGSMLWTRTIQWNWTMHTFIKFVPEQRCLCILGSLPSIWKGQQTDSTSIYDWIHKVHAPNESQHHYGFGLQGLIIFCTYWWSTRLSYICSCLSSQLFFLLSWIFKAGLSALENKQVFSAGVLSVLFVLNCPTKCYLLIN